MKFWLFMLFASGMVCGAEFFALVGRRDYSGRWLDFVISIVIAAYCAATVIDIERKP